MTQEGWAASPRSLSSPASPRYGVDTHVPTREHLGRCAHLTQRTGEGWPTAPDTPPHIPKATLVSPQTPETSTGQFTCYENRTFSLATDRPGVKGQKARRRAPRRARVRCSGAGERASRMSGVRAVRPHEAPQLERPARPSRSARPPVRGQGQAAGDAAISASRNPTWEGSLSS
jgi:hypothetical protein